MWPWQRRPASDPSSSFGETSGSSYGELIEAELRDEGERKRSIEARGLAVVTSTGVIVAIAVSLGPTFLPADAELPAEALAFVTFGGLLLATGIVCGIVANAPMSFDVAEGDFLRRITATERFWTAPRKIGSRRSAEVRVKELLAARKANTRKSWWLRLALLTEALGIVCLGSAAFVTFVMRSMR